MRRPLTGFAITALIVGCSLDGLTGGDDPVTPPPRPPPPPICTLADAPKCDPAHGHCVEENAVAKCACDTGWTGPTCTECAIGAACSAPTCADVKCAAHSTCDDANGAAPSCKCIVGYAANGADCKWAGVIKDPGFSETPPGSWIGTGNVVVNAAATGVTDPGEVELKTNQCAAAAVQQSFTMPSFTSAEPLAISVTGTGQCNSLFFSFCFSPIGMVLNGRGTNPFLVLLSNTPQTTRTCLGDRVYGGTTNLSFFTTLCTSTSVQSIKVDHAEIVAAPECPSPNIVPNADFEGLGGWTVGGTGAEVAAGIGNQSSRGGRLHNLKRCDEARLSNLISVGSTEPAKPALTFTMKGTINRKMRVAFNGTPIGTLTGTSVYEKVSLCIPEAMRGVAGTLAFFLADDAAAGVCGDPDDYEFDFDDLKVESDASCEENVALTGGDFERKDIEKYWPKVENGGSVAFVRGASSAHAGTGSAQIVQYSCGKSSSLRSIVQLPAPNPAQGGPAIELFYKATTANLATYSVAGVDIPPATDWTKKVVCLAARRAGFPMWLDISASAGVDTCSSGTLMVDDVRAVLDPTCPVE